jgi:hypothetical protein
MYALGVMVVVALCLAWTITQPPSTHGPHVTARPAMATARPTVAPMPPLPTMTRPTVMPAAEVREAVVRTPPPAAPQATREPAFSGFGGFGSIDGLGGGGGGNWLSQAQPL